MIKKLWWQRKKVAIDLNQKQDGPPDFEDVIKNLFSRKKKKPNPSNFSGGSGPSKGNAKGVGALIALGAVVVVGVWGLSGIYIIKEGEQAAVLRFGEYVRTEGPGFHWYPRFVETVYEQSVDQIKTVSLSREMLTSEENIVSVAFTVNYRISNLKDYLFNVVDPTTMLNQVLDAAVRQIIGQSTLDNIISVDRTQITSEVKTEIEQLLKEYNTGIEIVSVNMQKATAPDPVKAAFDDVIKAREDRNHVINQAESYANKVIPVAEGRKARILDEAKAYKEKLVLQAQADVAQFNALLPEYNKSPNVIEKQIYLSTMQKVLQDNKVFIVEGDGNNNLFYMPGGLPTSTMPQYYAKPPMKGQTTSQASSDTVPMNQQMWMRWMEANKK